MIIQMGLNRLSDALQSSTLSPVAAVFTSMTHKNRRRSSYASWILISKTGIACPQPKIGSCSNNYYRILTICMSIWREFSHKSIPVFRNKNRNRVARMATILVCVSFSAPKSCHPPTILLVMLKRVFSPNGPFKGTVSQDFLLLVFFAWISFPPSPEYPIRTVSNFLERRYLQVKVHHRYQWHRWQTDSLKKNRIENLMTLSL
jgi:hypothetical protein